MFASVLVDDELNQTYDLVEPGRRDLWCLSLHNL